jgi:hypothetical protein
MIYLKKHNLLFVKPLKTASTSVEIALSYNATPEDIVTPISLKDELFRLETNGQMPVNYAVHKRQEPRYIRKIRIISRLHARFPSVSLEKLSGIVDMFYYSRVKRLLSNHNMLAEVIQRKGEAFLRDSFLVTMCRNPYDVLLSRVYWEKWKKERVSEFDLSPAVDAMLERGPLNFDYYFYNGEYLPDFVIRYEHLNDDLAKLEKKFGLKLVENLPFTKEKVKKEKKSAKEILTDRQRALCYEKNRLIFEKFGYEK